VVSLPEAKLKSPLTLMLQIQYKYNTGLSVEVSLLACNFSLVLREKVVNISCTSEISEDVLAVLIFIYSWFTYRRFVFVRTTSKYRLITN
jgi:hypothetical protein